MIAVRVQTEAFDLAAETRALSEGRTDIGAVASFVGFVRGGEVEALTLEHYPAMTAKALEAIAAEAASRWPLLGGTVIHRHGRLLPGEPNRARRHRRRAPRRRLCRLRIRDGLSENRRALLEKGRNQRRKPVGRGQKRRRRRA